MVHQWCSGFDQCSLMEQGVLHNAAWKELLLLASLYLSISTVHCALQSATIVPEHSQISILCTMILSTLYVCNVHCAALQVDCTAPGVKRAALPAFARLPRPACKTSWHSPIYIVHLPSTKNHHHRYHQLLRIQQSGCCDGINLWLFDHFMTIVCHFTYFFSTEDLLENPHYMIKHYRLQASEDIVSVRWGWGLFILGKFSLKE